MFFNTKLKADLAEARAEAEKWKGKAETAKKLAERRQAESDTGWRLHAEVCDELSVVQAELAALKAQITERSRKGGIALAAKRRAAKAAKLGAAA